MIQAHTFRRLAPLRKEDVTPEVLCQIIRFDAETGKYFLTSRPREFFQTQRGYRAFNSRFAGQEIFKAPIKKGYHVVTILGHSFFAHRVIWAFHYGEWPSECIDHINGDRADNRLENLRQVPLGMNAKNQGISIRNTSGRVGVQWRKQRKNWRSYIEVNQKEIHLGTFANFEDAVAARELAEKQYGFHPNHGNERPRYAHSR